MEQKHLAMIDETLSLLADKIHEETGEDMLIGWGLLDNESDLTIEGCVTSQGLEYSTACKLLCGITAYAMDWYGGEPDGL